jgi:hypothetical protein
VNEESLLVAKHVLPYGAIPATVAFAERTAMLTGELLKLLHVVPDGDGSTPLTLPAEFLLEVGAVAQLLDWKLNGFAKVLGDDVADAGQLANQLGERARRHADGFVDQDASTAAKLSRKVLRLWIERFAWNSPSELGCDLVLPELDDDEDLVGCLADILWRHRHLIQTGDRHDSST